jgi:hypothetical protein
MSPAMPARDEPRDVAAELGHDRAMIGGTYEMDAP